MSTLADQIKKAITADIDCGLIDASVASFSELHDYVDANEYGADAPIEEFAAAQEEVDQWLRAGRPGDDTIAMLDLTINGTTYHVDSYEWLETSGFHSFDETVAAAIGNAVVDRRPYVFNGDRREGALLVWLGTDQDAKTDHITWTTTEEADI